MSISNNNDGVLRHPVVVLDVDSIFTEFLGELYDPRCEDASYSKQEIMIATLRFLHFEHQLCEANEAMMVDIVSRYQPVMDTHYDIARMSDSISQYLKAMQEALHACGLYDQNGELRYTFGGWASPYNPFLIHPQQIPQFIKAVSLRVESQYEVAEDYYHSHFWRPDTYLKVAGMRDKKQGC